MNNSVTSSSTSSSRGDTREKNEENDKMITNIDIHDDIIVLSKENGNGLSMIDTSSANESSIMSVKSDRRILKKQKSLQLLNTKSYLMNSLLHFQDRDKITAQLTKQKTVGRKSRNYHHGRIYNYVLPAPECQKGFQVLFQSIALEAHVRLHLLVQLILSQSQSQIFYRTDHHHPDDFYKIEFCSSPALKAQCTILL